MAFYLAHLRVPTTVLLLTCCVTFDQLFVFLKCYQQNVSHPVSARTPRSLKQLWLYEPLSLPLGFKSCPCCTLPRTERQSRLFFDVNGLLNKSVFQSPELNQPHRGSDKGQYSEEGSHCQAQEVDSDRPTVRSSASPSPLS